MSLARSIAPVATHLFARILQNLGWAFGYKILAPGCAGMAQPVLAGAAMAFSSVSVVTNSLRLRRFRPHSTG